MIGFHVRGVTVSSLDPLELEAWKPSEGSDHVVFSCLKKPEACIIFTLLTRVKTAWIIRALACLVWPYSRAARISLPHVLGMVWSARLLL